MCRSPGRTRPRRCALSLEGFSSNPPIVTSARGLARLLPAAFLAFWLCGWFAGEVFALGGVLNALAALFDFDLPSWVPAVRVGANAALPVLAFLVVWLSLWTFGGIAAMSALALLLWGREEVSWGADGMSFVQSAAPFRFAKTVTWPDVWRIEKTHTGVVVTTRRGRHTLGTASSEAERDAIAEQLRAALKFARPDAGGRRWALGPEASAGPAGLPKGWSEEMDETGQMAAAESPRTRRFAGGMLFVFAAVIVLPLGQVIGRAQDHGWTGGAVTGVVLLSLLMLLLVWGSVMVALQRQSLHPRSGAILHRVRRPGGVHEKSWSPARLALDCRTDSDGDEWWSLNVSGGSETPATLVSTMRDPAPALALGRWLSVRASVPFEDDGPDSSRRSA